MPSTHGLRLSREQLQKILAPLEVKRQSDQVRAAKAFCQLVCLLGPILVCCLLYLVEVL